MKVSELKALLAGLPDDGDLIVELNPSGECSYIENLLIDTQSYGGKTLHSLLEVVAQESKENDAIFDEQLRLGIPQEFIDFCQYNTTSPKEVLHGFIADLMALDNYTSNPRKDNLCRNGSDECDFAEQYFRRVGYQYRSD